MSPHTPARPSRRAARHTRACQSVQTECPRSGVPVSRDRSVQTTEPPGGGEATRPAPPARHAHDPCASPGRSVLQRCGDPESDTTPAPTRAPYGFRRVVSITPTDYSLRAPEHAAAQAASQQPPTAHADRRPARRTRRAARRRADPRRAAGTPAGRTRAAPAIGARRTALRAPGARWTRWPPPSRRLEQCSAGRPPCMLRLPRFVRCGPAARHRSAAADAAAAKAAPAASQDRSLMAAGPGPVPAT